MEGFRFASEFLRGDRIIMRPQWRRSARWKDDARHYPAANDYKVERPLGEGIKLIVYGGCVPIGIEKIIIRAGRIP